MIMLELDIHDRGRTKF